MYNTGELKFKKDVSYSEMVAIALQYSKNVLDAMHNDGCVTMDFMRVCAVLYAFTDGYNDSLNGDDVMKSVYSYGFKNYMDYIMDNTPMGAEFFDAFIRMLDRADKMAEKHQPIDVLMDSLIRMSDNISALLQSDENGVSPLSGVIEGLGDIIKNGGVIEATP